MGRLLAKTESDDPWEKGIRSSKGRSRYGEIEFHHKNSDTVNPYHKVPTIAIEPRSVSCIEPKSHVAVLSFEFWLIRERSLGRSGKLDSIRHEIYPDHVELEE